MTETYLHLTLTHFPIVGSIIAVLLLGTGYWRKNVSLTKAALYLLLGLAVLTFVVNHTGEEAEEFVEHLPGYSGEAIHAHEEIAEWAFQIMLLTGLGAAAALLLLKRRSKKARLAVLLVLLVNLVACGLLVYAGKKGGEIRHTEIYDTPAATLSPAPELP